MKSEYFLNKNLSKSEFIENILSGIDLRFINNLMNREDSPIYKFLHRVTPKKYRENININIKDKKIFHNYKKLRDVEKMGTSATFYLINSICKSIKKGSYLNIGIWKGFSLFDNKRNFCAFLYLFCAFSTFPFFSYFFACLIKL